jgi:site-specific DNA recombinase
MRIAIYARVSTERQEKQETINSQLDALRDFAKKSNDTVYKEYIDEGYSGELLDRPALDQLRDDAKKKLFEAILVHSPDRLSRKYLYLGIVQEIRNKHYLLKQAR